MMNSSLEQAVALVKLADAPASFEPTDQVDENVLCDIDEPVLFQAVLTRLKSIVDKRKWDVIAHQLARLSPRSFVVSLAADGIAPYGMNAERLKWMLREPNPYILNHPTMIHEVRALYLDGMQSIPSSLHHFTSLHKLDWISHLLLLPDDAFSLLRQHVTGLQDLYVSTERLTAPMLNDIAQMTNLESLRLVAHEYDAIPPLGNLRGLKTLKIWDYKHYQRQRQGPLIFHSTLVGLTRIETLELGVLISEHLVIAIPAMFPFLRELLVIRIGWSDNAKASLKSHYENKEGFKLLRIRE